MIRSYVINTINKYNREDNKTRNVCALLGRLSRPPHVKTRLAGKTTQAIVTHFSYSFMIRRLAYLLNRSQSLFAK